MVITGRNDDYGVDFVDRLRRFVISLDYQCRAYRGLLEVIFVEWNPLPDHDGIIDIIPRADNFDIRIITVGPDVHESLDPHVPVLEWHAKNTGARRSRGQFVLLTNPDILFSQDLIDMFAQRNLDPDVFYRTDRFDFRDVDLDLFSPDAWIQQAANHVYQGHVTVKSMSTQVMIRIEPGTHVPIDKLPASKFWQGHIHTNGAGDFILAHRATFDEVGGMWEQTKQRWHVDAYSCCRLYVLGFDCHVITAPACIFHQDHARRDPDRPLDQSDANSAMLEAGDSDWGLDGLDLKESLIGRSS